MPLRVLRRGGPKWDKTCGCGCGCVTDAPEFHRLEEVRLVEYAPGLALMTMYLLLLRKLTDMKALNDCWATRKLSGRESRALLLVTTLDELFVRRLEHKNQQIVPCVCLVV